MHVSRLEREALRELRQKLARDQALWEGHRSGPTPEQPRP